MKVLLPFFKYLKRHKIAYMSGMLLSVIYGASSGFGMAFVTAKILPVLFNKEGEVSYAYKLLMISLIPGVAIFKACSGYFSTYLISMVEKKIKLELQTELMDHIQSLSLAFYDKQRTGSLMARVVNDCDRIAGAVTSCTADLVRQPVTIIGAFSVIVYLSFHNKDVVFLSIALLLLPFCVGLARHIGKRLTAREEQIGQSEGALNNIIHENMSSAREVRAFNLQNREMTRFRDKALHQMSIGMRLLAYRNAISPATEIIVSIGVAGALLYVINTKVSMESVIPLLMALYLCYDPWKTLGKTYAQIQRASLAVGRIKGIHEAKQKLEDPENPTPCPPFQKSIRMENVSFSYPGNHRALHKVSLEIHKGEVVALIGPSGAGKSTASHLLCRFYDPNKGAILYDEHDLRDFAQADLRERIAFVPQDSFLFADTIMNNIRMGRLDATDEEVMEAACKAHADIFIKELPNGYDTIVAERGSSLSGGQRQRISIARAFLRNAEILILDEATSSLDAESESIIHQAFEKLFENRTVIIIAHRYSTIRMADKIIFFQDGRVVMEGDQSELEQKSEFFQRLKYAGSDTFLKQPPHKTD